MRLRRRPALTEEERSRIADELSAETRRRAAEHPELCPSCWHPRSDHEVRDQGPPETIVCRTRRCRCHAVRSWSAFPPG